MKRKLWLKNLIIVIIPALFAVLLACSNEIKPENRLITVMNPAITEKHVERIPLTSRLDTLEGKTIYLVDMNYEGILGTPVMNEIQNWFSINMPEVKTVLRIKSGNYVADDPALWKEIKENKGDAVIMGVAG